MMWEKTEFTFGDCLFWQMGPLQLWVRRIDGEWQTAIERVPESAPFVSAQRCDPPDGASWTRWAAHPDDVTFQLRPIMPDRPVIVRPESAFSFPPQSDLMFYVSIPVAIQMCTGSVAEVPLMEVPSVVLSNSWFGEPVHGQLCYALKTTARRTLDDLRVSPHLVACPIHIQNRSGTVLAFERLCLQTQHMAIFQDQRRLWTNQVGIQHGAGSAQDTLEFSQGAPDVSWQANCLTEARLPVRKTLLQKSFFNIKSFMRM